MMRRLTSIAITIMALIVVVRASRGAPAPGETEESVGQLPSFSVEFRGHSLFQITAPIGKLTPAQRAHEIGRRIRDVASGLAGEATPVRTIDRDDRTDVVAGDHLILSVTDADARSGGRTRRQVAADEQRHLA